MFFFLVSMGPVLLWRHRHITLDHARTAAELKSAREIQQRLVPSLLPQRPGCRIQAAYLPADEVEGDFYQVLPLSDGSTCIAVGDVSGKGLKAAMTGALAIGALRTLASQGFGPAAILQRLNAELVSTANGGFITCICAQLYPDGLLRLANAGHLAPYRNGEEIACDGSLPLGLSEAACYGELTLNLSPGDQLTLLSDGVVEAQTSDRELFGFDRTRALSTNAASDIAAAAQAFGQEDDITVLTIQFVPAEVLYV